MPSVYTAEQTTFFFSMLTNLAGVMQGTPDEIERFVAGRLDVHIQDAKPRIGDWTRVWGPAVYQAPLSNYLRYLMSGGLNFRQLAPNALIPVLKGVERLLYPIQSHLALHHLIAVRRN